MLSIAVNAVITSIDRSTDRQIDSYGQQSTAIDSNRQHPIAIDSIDSYQQPQYKDIVIDSMGEGESVSVGGDEYT